MDYYSIGKFAKLIEKTTQTLRDWHKKGELIPHHVTPSGYRYYSQEQLHHFLILKTLEKKNKNVYESCLVSLIKSPSTQISIILPSLNLKKDAPL